VGTKPNRERQDRKADHTRPPAAAPASLDLLTTEGFADYALLDSGNGRKLERFGTVIVDRPEVQCLWSPRRPDAWAQAHAVFSASGEDEEKGRWRVDRPFPESWPVRVAGVTMLCRLAGLWHLGLFPEQLPHWQWMLEGIARITVERPRVLNLFAYTGAASLIAARAGAEVTHVDASRKAIAWAKDNQAASGLSDAPVRWILEDARKFAARERRRGRTYHIVMVDPPKFGRGPNNEAWDLFQHLPALLSDCAALLAPGPSRLCLTCYAIRASALAMDGLAREVMASRPGSTESGELAIREQSGGRLLGTSLFTRWTAR
jgi:23S rRNA (cytosine1962-C5)-methyltransferase